MNVYKKVMVADLAFYKKLTIKFGTWFGLPKGNFVASNWSKHYLLEVGMNWNVTYMLKKFMQKKKKRK